MKSKTNKDRNLFSYSRYRELLNEAKMTPEESSNYLKMAFRDDPVNCAFLDLVFENRNSLEGLEDGAPDAIEMKRKLSVLYSYLIDLHQNKN